MTDWNAAWSPQFVYVDGTTFRTLISTFESGKEQRRKKWTTDRKRFHVVFNAIDKTTADAIKSLYAEKCGAYDTFSFTNPADSTSYTVRFVEDSFSEQFITSTACKIEVDLIEVI